MIEKSNYLIDSNIIIYHLNAQQIATDFLQANVGSLSISRLTFIEVLSFDFSYQEEEQVARLLRTFQIIDTSDAIALQCVKNRQYKKIKLADNIIASTAQVHGLTLVTRNVKDFSNLQIKLLNIFE